MAPTFSQRFHQKKTSILSKLGPSSSSPSSSGTADLSPKGSIDAQIQDLVTKLNSSSKLTDAYVTTSSCSGRVAVYLEGPANVSSAGGKGGGKWLYTSHDPVDLEALKGEGAVYRMLGLDGDALSLERFPGGAEDGSEEQVQMVHLKFEPLILHILTATLAAAEHAVTCALSAGFRESSAIGLTSTNPTTDPATPMVAVRSTGLAFESIIAYYSPRTSKIHPVVSEDLLRALLRRANERFRANEERRARFEQALFSTESRYFRSLTSEDRKDFETRGSVEAREARREGQRAMRRRSSVMDHDVCHNLFREE